MRLCLLNNLELGVLLRTLCFTCLKFLLLSLECFRTYLCIVGMARAV